MATKMTENSKRRSRKTASFQPSAVLEPRKDRDRDKDKDPNKDVALVSTPAASNLEEEIRRRAYELYLERGATSGDPGHDWLVAEQEVRGRQMHQAG